MRRMLQEIHPTSGPISARIVKSPSTNRCVYCGVFFDKTTNLRTKDHVPPNGLYPESRRTNSLQLLTVPVCTSCNASMADDEVHFRSLLMLAGDNPNQARIEKWATSVRDSFAHPDGPKRLIDLVDRLEPAIVDGRARHRVYPDRDERVLRVVRKIVRGLSFHHGLTWPVQDEWIHAEVLRYRIPPGFEDEIEGVGWYHVERDVLEYRFGAGEDGVNFWWLLTFYEACTFAAWIRLPEPNPLR